MAAPIPLDYLAVFNNSFNNVGYGISSNDSIGNLTVMFNTLNYCSSFGLNFLTNTTSFYIDYNTFLACSISIPIPPTPPPTAPPTPSPTPPPTAQPTPPPTSPPTPPPTSPPTSPPTPPPTSPPTTPSPTLSCDTNNGGCDYKVQCYYSNSSVTCGLCPLDTEADGTDCKGKLYVRNLILFPTCLFSASVVDPGRKLRHVSTRLRRNRLWYGYLNCFEMQLLTSNNRCVRRWSV